MLAPTELYLLVLAWLQAIGCCPHATARVALAHHLTAVLVAQSLRPADRSRALLSAIEVPARQRFQRAARALDRASLSPQRLTPFLVRAVLALVTPDRAGTPTAGLTHLALDSLRCGPWEIFTLSVVWCGRGIPVGWAVLPYPWPKGRFGPTVCGLIRQVAAAWPDTRPAHLVADRAFPSYALCGTLQAVGWGWTIRLQARHPVTVGGQRQWVRALLASARVGVWTARAGSYGSGPRAVVGTVVVGRGLVVLPAHQRTVGSLRHRAKQRARRAQHVATKHRHQRPDASGETDAWVVLFTSHASWHAASVSYRRRWAAEGSYRDAQSGWDGRHGWNLEPTVARVRVAAQVERLVGLWALGAVVQTWIGSQVSHGPAPVQAVLHQWTTTGRLSVWGRGRLALTDRSGDLGPWLRRILRRGARRIAAAPPPPPTGLARSPQAPERLPNAA